MAISDAAIRDYLAANANLSDAQIAADMNKHGVSYAQMAAVTGLPVGDVESRYLGANGASTLPQLNTLANAFASTSSPATLTPEIASNLMQRSMTTGVPTSEFDKYGGYDKVAALYNQNNGVYDLTKLDAAFLDQVDDIIANTGVGNLSVLKQTGTPLTEAGRQAMINNGISWTNDDLKAMNIPYEGFLKAPTLPTANAGAAPGGLSAGSGISSGAGDTGAGAGQRLAQIFGASDGRLMGAGNANYNSSLIKALRQSSLTPFSNNAGIQMFANQGATTSDWEAPNMADAAFSPSVLSPRLATDQEVSDWNDYQAYKTNSIGAKTPILSMEEWIAKGRADGKPAAVAPVDTTWDSGSYGA